MERLTGGIASVCLLFLCACGELAGFGDFQKVKSGSAGGDGSGRGASTAEGDIPGSRKCDPNKPFGAPTAIPGAVNTPADEVAPSLTADELTLVFQRSLTVGQGSIWGATRGSVDQPFGAPTELFDLKNGLEQTLQPSITADGLSLFFVGVMPSGGIESLHKIYVAGRPTANGPFTGRRIFDEVNGAPDKRESWPTIWPHSEELWLSSDRASPEQRLFRSVRSRDGQYQAPVLIAELSTGIQEFGTAFSPDGLTILFGSERAGGLGQHDIWTATRANAAAPFGPPRHVPELSTPGMDIPSFLSRDGCRLYFTSERRGGMDGDIFMASRE